MLFCRKIERMSSAAALPSFNELYARRPMSRRRGRRPRAGNLQQAWTGFSVTEGTNARVLYK